MAYLLSVLGWVSGMALVFQGWFLFKRAMGWKI